MSGEQIVIRRGEPADAHISSRSETSAAPVTAERTPDARSKPSMAAISNQWLHMRTTLASIKSVQKIKVQYTSLSRSFSIPAFTFAAVRGFLKAIALDLCNCTSREGSIIGSANRHQGLRRRHSLLSRIRVSHRR